MAVSRMGTSRLVPLLVTARVGRGFHVRTLSGACWVARYVQYR
jgi:hypothetical protein